MLEKIKELHDLGTELMDEMEKEGGDVKKVGEKLIDDLKHKKLLDAVKELKKLLDEGADLPKPIIKFAKGAVSVLGLDD